MAIVATRLTPGLFHERLCPEYLRGQFVKNGLLLLLLPLSSSPSSVSGTPQASYGLL